ncbi:MAG: aldo/keto reductase family protein [Brevinema sp.]
MKYRRLGKTGLKISEISIGGWLTYGNTTEKQTTEAIIDTAYDLGINMFDCANVYALGESEKVMGELLSKYPRDSYILTTKAFWPMGDKPNDRGLSRKHLHTQINASLKRLNTDYIDIFYCHRFDPDSNLYETVRTIDDFVRQGKILYIGVSEWTACQILEGLRVQDQYLLDRFVVNQPVYNLIQRYIEPEVLPTCIQNGMGIIPFSPLAQGFLSGKYRKGREIPKDSRAANEEISQFIQRYLTPDNFDAIEIFISMAEQKGCTPSQLALAWILHQPGVVSTLTGASKPSQVEDNVNAINIELSLEELRKLENIFVKNIDK